MKKSNILIIGCSRLGASIASKASLEGKNVTIIDDDPGAFVKLDSSYSGFTLDGDATEIPVLEKAKISEMNEVDILTDDDNTNILLANLISFYYPEVSTIIVRIIDETKAVLVDKPRVKVICPGVLAIKQYEKVKEDR